MGRLVEGVWDCTYCDAKNIQAGKKECPACGAPQGEHTVFRLPNQINYVSDADAAKISRNPDWQCSYCQQLNSADTAICKGCGASQQESERNYFQMHENTKKQKSNLDSEESLPELKSSEGTHQRYRKDSEVDKPAIFSRYNINHINLIISKIPWKQILAIVGILALITTVVFLFIPRAETVTVSGFEWNYTIDIEELCTVQESDWTLPAGGRLHYTQQEIRSYKKVLDHYETVTETKSRQVPDGYEEYSMGYRDLGNGYFEEITSTRPKYRTEYYTETSQKPVYRDEPVYATKYYYEIDKWKYSHSIKTSGKDKNPYWGEVTLRDKERTGSRGKDFHINCITDSDKQARYSLAEADWQTLNLDDRIEIQVNNLGMIYEFKYISDKEDIT